MRANRHRNVEHEEFFAVCRLCAHRMWWHKAEGATLEELRVLDEPRKRNAEKLRASGWL